MANKEQDIRFENPRPQIVDPVQAEILACSARIVGSYLETQQMPDGRVSIVRMPETTSKKEGLSRADELVRKLVEDVLPVEAIEAPQAEQSDLYTSMPIRIQSLPTKVDTVFARVLRTAVAFHTADMPALGSMRITPTRTDDGSDAHPNRFSVSLGTMDPAMVTTVLQTASNINNCLRTIAVLRSQSKKK